MTKKKSPKSLAEKLYRIAIYTRVSTEEQAENPEGSIKNQEQRIREFIKLKNMVEPCGEVEAIFSDPGKSAKDMNRPGFQKMLTAIRSQEIDMVVVTELSRFSRSTKDFTMLQEFLEENGCKFLSLRENFDTSGAAGSMVMNLMASIAEFERRQTAERISNSFLARSKRGLYNGGSLPLGYRIDESKPGYLFIDPDEAEIVRFAFRSFIRHGTLAATAKFLTANKIRLPKKVHGSGAIRESQFTVDSLYRMLRNKAYIGVRVFQTKTGPEEVPAVWEPILDRQIFERVNEMLTQNCNHKRTHGENRYPYTLSGITFCEQCGERMSGKSAHGKAGKVGYYEHIKTARMQSGNPEKLQTHNPHRVPAIKLEPVVWQEVKNFVLSAAFARDLLERAKLMQEAKNHTDELSKLRQKVKLTENQIEVLAERIATLPKDLDLKPLLHQLIKLQQTKTDWEAELRIQENEKPKVDEPVCFEDLQSFRRGLKSLIEKGEKDKDVQTAIIKKVVHKITIKPNGFEIHFHVGQTYYSREPGANTPGSRIFLSEKGKRRASGSSQPAGRSQIADFLKDQSSSLLTNGDPASTRTRDLLLRRQLLYPAELRDHVPVF